MAVFSEWLAYFPYYSSSSTRFKNASLTCIFYMVVSLMYRYKSLLGTYRIPGWKFQIDNSLHKGKSDLINVILITANMLSRQQSCCLKQKLFFKSS